MRYQIVYMKRGFPLTTWADDADRAQRLAAQLRRAGYSVDVWQHTDEGARKTTPTGRTSKQCVSSLFSMASPTMRLELF